VCGGGVIQGEELDDTLACPGNPVDEGEEVAEIADAGAVSSTEGEERYDGADELEGGSPPEGGTTDKPTAGEGEGVAGVIKAAVLAFFPNDEAGLGLVDEDELVFKGKGEGLFGETCGTYQGLPLHGDRTLPIPKCGTVSGDGQGVALQVRGKGPK
jgi:hypothetical protein